MNIWKQSLWVGFLSSAAITLTYAVTHPAPPSKTTLNSKTLPYISGNYQCKGYDPFGKSNYSNPLTVTKNGNTYAFQWLSANKYPLLLGTGVFNKSVNNMIAVVFWDPKKAEYFGTEVYTITNTEDGLVLKANWTLQAQTLVGEETCTRVNP